MAWQRDFINFAHLEVGLGRIGETKNSDVNQGLFMYFVYVKEAWEAGSLNSSDDSSEDSDINVGLGENVPVCNEFAKPRINL